MKDTNAIRTFVTLLERQATLIEALAEREADLQELVTKRAWDDLETLIPQMTDLGEAINHAEEERSAVYEEIVAAVGGERSFAYILSHLPIEVRTTLSGAYRRLKVAVLRLQSRTSSVDTYLNSTISTTRGVLRELYPEHASVGYSRSGRNRFGNGSPVMVDRAL